MTLHVLPTEDGDVHQLHGECQCDPIYDVLDDGTALIVHCMPLTFVECEAWDLDRWFVREAR